MTTVDSTTKICRDCGMVRPLEDFPEQPKSRDGRGRRCLECKEAKLNLWETADDQETYDYEREAQRRKKARHNDPNDRPAWADALLEEIQSVKNEVTALAEEIAFLRDSLGRKE